VGLKKLESGTTFDGVQLTGAIARPTTMNGAVDSASRAAEADGRNCLIALQAQPAGQDAGLCGRQDASRYDAQGVGAKKTPTPSRP